MNQPSDILTSESWEYSRNYASLLGAIPNSFGTTIRSLVSDHEKTPGTLSQGTRFLVTRLLRSKNMKAPYYFAAKRYKPEALGGKNDLSEQELITIFKPDEMAAIFGTVYLFKKAKKHCNPAEMAFLLPFLHKEIDVAGLVGLSIPAAGLANAILTYGMRYVAATTFLKHNVKHFQEYRRLTKNSKSIFNLEKEVEYFGCSTPQIGSIFLQTLGFGIQFSTDYAYAIASADPSDKTDANTSPFKVVRLWTKSLIDKGTAPELSHAVKYYPDSQATLDELIAKSKEEPSNWLEKTPEDLPSSGIADEKPAEESEEAPDELSEENVNEPDDLQ